jgi:hypothetical protein
MSLGTIIFWDNSFDKYGVPKSVHSYLVSVFVNEVIGNGNKIVKIIQLTENSPKPPSDRPFIVKNSENKNAVNEAFTLLKNLPDLQAMKYYEAFISTTEMKPKLVSNW